MLVTAMDINVTTNTLNTYIYIYPNYNNNKKKAMLVTAMDINVTLDNIKKNPKLLILET